MRTIHLIAAAIAALASSTAFSATNIVTNGSFETTPSAVKDGDFDTFANSDNFLGWTIDSQLEIRNNRVGKAFDGAKFAELDAENNKNNTISQTLNTVIGATYTFSFEYSNRPFESVSNPVKVDASSSGLDFIIGNVSGSAPAQPTITDDKQHWNLFTTTFVATSTQTFLSLTSSGKVDNFGSSLDDVEVTLLANPVPEPGSYALMAAGLGAIGLITRRRRAN